MLYEVITDPHHPYQGHYLGDEDTRRKPAYHNGTAWSWPFPLYAEAMFRIYGDEAKERALSLLSSAIEYLVITSYSIHYTKLYDPCLRSP